MSENRYLQSLKSLGVMAKDAAAQARAKAVEEYWPMIEDVCRERVGPAALRMASNDERLTEIARAVYPTLPVALRLFVDESEFISFCLTNRDRLVALCGEAGDETNEK